MRQTANIFMLTAMFHVNQLTRYPHSGRESLEITGTGFYGLVAIPVIQPHCQSTDPQSLAWPDPSFIYQ